MDERLRAAFRAYAFSVVGVFLVMAPWSSLYDHTVLLAAAPVGVGGAVGSGWVRGGVSGLGVLDLLVAAREVQGLWRSMRASGGRPEGG